MAISVTGLTSWTQEGSGTWQEWGGGQASSQSTATFFSGASTRGRKFTGFKGMGFQVNASGQDLSNTILVIRWLVNGGLGSTLANDGARIYVEDTSANTGWWTIAGSDTYRGGWRVSVVDTSLALTGNGGTAPSMTALQYVGFYCDAAATSGGDPNVYIDEVLSLPNTGLTLAGNTTSLFDELATWDEASLYGVVERRAGVVFTKAPLILAPDASDHASTDETIVFEEPIYEDATNVDSALSETGFTSTDADTITLTRISAICEDNSDINGTNADKLLDFGGATDIDAPASTFSGFTGSDLDLNGANFDWDGTTFLNCANLTCVSTPSLNDTLWRQPAVAANESQLIWNPNADPNTYLTGAYFEKGTNAHHAIELGISSPTSITLTDVVVSGFNTTTNNQNDSTIHVKRTSGTVTINISGSGTSAADYTYRSDGATVVIQGSVDITLKNVVSGSQCAVYATDDDSQLMNEAAAGGDVVEAYAGSTPRDVIIRVRKSSGAPKYKYYIASGQIVSGTGLTVSVDQILDPIAV